MWSRWVFTVASEMKRCAAGSSRLVVAMPELAQSILERLMGKQVEKVRRSERDHPDS